jgi:hypothetical protein
VVAIQNSEFDPVLHRITARFSFVFFLSSRVNHRGSLVFFYLFVAKDRSQTVHIWEESLKEVRITAQTISKAR